MRTLFIGLCLLFITACKNDPPLLINQFSLDTPKVAIIEALKKEHASFEQGQSSINQFDANLTYFGANVSHIEYYFSGTCDNKHTLPCTLLFANYIITNPTVSFNELRERIAEQYGSSNTFTVTSKHNVTRQHAIWELSNGQVINLSHTNGLNEFTITFVSERIADDYITDMIVAISSMPVIISGMTS